MDHTAVQHLPAEIWLMIIEHLPASFFQKDLRRLTLSKRWYSLAFPIFYPRIEFTPRIISRLVHLRSKSLDKARDQLRKTLRFVTIVLDGLAPPASGRHHPPLPARAAARPPPPEVRAATTTTTTANMLCFNTPANLARFSLMLLDFRELREVRFAARWPNRDWLADPLPGNYLTLRSLEPYLSGVLTHVTAMDLDLCGTDVTDDDDNDDDGAVAVHHFCEYVRPLLSRLTSLRLRLRSICALALRPVPDGEGPVTLRELRLSLYLGKVSRSNPKLNMSRKCSCGDWQEWKDPLDEVRREMRRLVKDIAEPRRAEMVHLVCPGEVHVWDALTGLCVRKGSEKSWRFPSHFETYFKTTCVLKLEDCWERDNESGVGGMWPLSCSGETFEGVCSDELDEPDEPMGGG